MPDSLKNRLAGETSPYLLQHKDNPVAWQPWDEAALAAARANDRPILLSIGYSACHWCHVMAHESFEDAEVAAEMNRGFVCIKVDREERPDLDHIYQSAHQLLAGRAGGWPLTMFLTPDGTPFFGGTYFPKTPRYGLPGFADLCRRVAELYGRQRGDIERQNESLRAALDSSRPAGGDGDLDARALRQAQAMLLQSLDREHGGFGGAPKFPHPTELAFLLGGGDAAGRDAALLTLDRMAAGGLRDQIGGGFFRYSVDARWEIPHFEKMLYDNALLLPLYAEAWRQTGTARYREVAEDTAAWLLTMQSPAGGWYASLDADAGGAEGAYYVWGRDEVRALLMPAEWQAAAIHWGLDGPPNFEGHAWHLRVAAETAPQLIASASAKLLAARSQRPPPGRDDKILTSWNALAITGMTRAARLCGRPDWAAAARRALDFLHAELWRDGRLLACAKDGRARYAAYLDDHAFLLAALIETMQADFRSDDLTWAVEITDILLDRFEDKRDGGFFFTATDHEALIHRPKPGFDAATPAGNGIAAVALQRLGHLLGEPRYLDAARRTLAAFAPMLGNPAAASLLTALREALSPPPMVVLSGPVAAVLDWQIRLAQCWDGLCFAPPADARLPATLAKPAGTTVNAWVCSGVSCSAPVDDFDQLRRIILNRQ